MADWDTRLTFVITPKSGPLRKMVRLRDAQQALIADLPSGFLRRAHWLTAGKALVTAAETGKPKDIEWAFESIVAALDEEGWLPQGVSSITPPRSVVSSNDRVSVGNITPRPPDEPLWRRRAFEAVEAALDEEGWLPQGASRVPLPRSGPPRFDPLRFQSLRRVRPSVGSFTARRPAEPLWRRIHPVGTDRQAAEVSNGRAPASNGGELRQAAGADPPAQMRCTLAHSRPASAVDKHERLADVGPILDLSNKKLSDVRT